MIAHRTISAMAAPHANDNSMDYSDEPESAYAAPAQELGQPREDDHCAVQANRRSLLSRAPLGRADLNAQENPSTRQLKLSLSET